MGIGLSRLTGVLAIGLALLRLGRLLEPSVEGAPWPLVLVGATVLGALITWALRSVGASLGATIAVHALTIALLASRILAPGTLIAGLLPGPAAIAEIRTQLGIAAELIRFGAAPVLPVAGLLAVLALLFWVLGSLSATGRPLLSTMPALVVYLQFATLDRRPPGSGWIAAFVVVAAAALVSLTPATTASVGRARGRDGELLARRSPSVLVTSITAAALVALTASAALAAFIPESGLLSWRTQSGIGSGLYGSGSFNLFVGLQQSLVDLSDEPMFYARLSESAPTDRGIYWKLITLDTFDGQYWRPSQQTFAKGGEPRWENPEWQFQGPTTRIAATVRIAGLKGQYLPTLYSPIGLSSDEALISESFRVREDGSVAVDLQAIDNWTYQIDADMPIPDVDSLATRNGELSPIFAEANAAGVVRVSPSEAPVSERPESISTYLTLPEGVAQEVRELARVVTSGATTGFERALLLEAFFRDPEIFTYSTDVDTGHTTLDLEEWLTDGASRNYRTGYCEQFATAMGVMARTLGIPSRVVLGFTPGQPETQEDGSEVIVVRERNAHAWVELWMDGQGWVRFDPTPRSDGINPSTTNSEIGADLRRYIPESDGVAGQGAGATQSALPDRIDEGEELPDTGAGLGEGAAGDFPIPLGWIAGVLALAAAIPIYKLIRRKRRLARISRGEVDVAWNEIIDRLSDLGAGIDPAHTPIEIARSESHDLLPLAHLYSAAAYGGQRSVDCLDEFKRAEDGLRRRYEGRRWRTSYVKIDSLRR